MTSYASYAIPVAVTMVAGLPDYKDSIRNIAFKVTVFMRAPVTLHDVIYTKSVLKDNKDEVPRLSNYSGHRLGKQCMGVGFKVVLCN